jgi:hypothetical protein
MSIFHEQREEIVRSLGFFWTRVFLGTEFLLGYTSSLAVPFKDLEDAMDNLPDYMSRYKIPLKEKEQNRLFIFDEENLVTDADHYGDPGLVYGGGKFYGSQLQTFNEFKFSFDDDLEPMFLTTSIIDPEAILQLGVDYTIEDGFLIFKDNPFELQGVEKQFRTDEDENQFLISFLWGFQVEEDIQAVRDYFGILGGVVQRESTALYKRAVNAAWNLKVDGATIVHMVEALSAITDVDFVNQDGTVLAVFEEGDRRVVQTDNAVYTAPLDCQALVVESDQLLRGDIIFDAFKLKSGRDFIDFADFEALALGAGYVDRNYGGSLLFVNDLVDVTLGTHPDAVTFEKAESGNGWYKIGADGILTGFVESEEEVLDTIDNTPQYFYEFFVGGTEEGVAQYMRDLNEQGDLDLSFFEALAEKYGRVPLKLNPFEEIKDLLLKYNSFYIKIKDSIADQAMFNQLFSVLTRTISAGSTFFLIVEKTPIEEEVEAVIEESVEAFLVAEIDEDVDSLPSERILTSPQV